MADRYGREAHRGERPSHPEDRGFIDRAGDEVRSWLGDEDAERRRRLDDQERERHERMYGYGGEPREPRGEYGPSFGYGWASAPNRPYRAPSERGWAGEYDRSGAVSRGWNEPNYGYRPSYGYGYGDKWTREGAWRSGEPRRMGESRGIYEDSRGRLYHFEHGGTFAGRGPKGYLRSDDRIREDVCDRLTDDGRVDASDIEVTVQNGEVTLSGTVHSREAKRATENLAESISGVREVHDNLRVSRWQEDTTGATSTTTTAATASTPPSGASGTTRR